MKTETVKLLNGFDEYKKENANQFKLETLTEVRFLENRLWHAFHAGMIYEAQLKPKALNSKKLKR